MNVQVFAGLGSARGVGESLLSWLSAGPLGTMGAETCGLFPDVNADSRRLFCPACRLDESGRRRWYSRDTWNHPACVICDTHALPLVRSDAPPACLRSRGWPRTLRAEFRDLASWTSAWARPDTTRRAGPLRAAEMALVRALLARTDPRLAFSVAQATSQWELWLEGWPVPASPRDTAPGGTWPWRQSERLALMGVTHRICRGLQRGESPVGSRLLLRPRALGVLCARVRRLRPAWRTPLSNYFHCSPATRSSHGAAAHQN